jgi:hypothetical protein
MLGFPTLLDGISTLLSSPYVAIEAYADVVTCGGEYEGQSLGGVKGGAELVAQSEVVQLMRGQDGKVEIYMSERCI